MRAAGWQGWGWQDGTALAWAQSRVRRSSHVPRQLQSTLCARRRGDVSPVPGGGMAPRSKQSWLQDPSSLWASVGARLLPPLHFMPTGSPEPLTRVSWLWQWGQCLHRCCPSIHSRMATAHPSPCQGGFPRGSSASW